MSCISNARSGCDSDRKWNGMSTLDHFILIYMEEQYTCSNARGTFCLFLDVCWGYCVVLRSYAISNIYKPARISLFLPPPAVRIEQRHPYTKITNGSMLLMEENHNSPETQKVKNHTITKKKKLLYSNNNKSHRTDSTYISTFDFQDKGKYRLSLDFSFDRTVHIPRPHLTPGLTPPGTASSPPQQSLVHTPQQHPNPPRHAPYSSLPPPLLPISHLVSATFVSQISSLYTLKKKKKTQNSTPSLPNTGEGDGPSTPPLAHSPCMSSHCMSETWTASRSRPATTGTLPNSTLPGSHTTLCQQRVNGPATQQKKDYTYITTWPIPYLIGRGLLQLSQVLVLSARLHLNLCRFPLEDRLHDFKRVIHHAAIRDA